MAKNTKTAPGATGHETKVRLLPVKYQISLHYLGDRRVRHEENNYTCRFELEPGGRTAAGPLPVPFPIGNVFPHRHRLDETNKAAMPHALGGDNRPPPGAPNLDEVFRILVDDRHARPSDAAGEGSLERFSRPQAYALRRDGGYQWEQDVAPALAFRVAVRKQIGDQPVDLDTDPSVLLELKDPREERDVYDGQQQQFLDEFFGYNGTRIPANEGDDNCHASFHGTRGKHVLLNVPPVPAPEKGPVTALPDDQVATALDRVRGAPYVGGPSVAEPVAPAARGQVAIGSLEQLTPVDSPRVVRLGPLTLVDEPAGAGSGRRPVKVGVTDFAFLPGSVSGDNFRFLLSLQNDGRDIRATREEGHGKPLLLDDRGREIDAPRGYLTGRFVLWRRIRCSLFVCMNNTNVNMVAWDRIISTYRKSFIELVKPDAQNAAIVSIGRAEWEERWRDVFKPAPGEPGWTAANFSAAVYSDTLVPAFLFGKPGDMFQTLRDYIRSLIRDTCKLQGARFNPDPTKDRQQRRNYGLCVVLCKIDEPGGRTVIPFAGEYAGDRILWCDLSGQVNDPSMTVAHELGHALFLRHALTGQMLEAELTTTSGAVERFRIIDSVSAENGKLGQNYIFDHDPAELFSCMMSYLAPPDSIPCGMCSLVLRHFDLPVIQEAREPASLERLGPVMLARIDGQSNTGGTLRTRLTQLDPNVPAPLSHSGGPIRIVALAAPRTVRPGGKGATTAIRINVSNESVSWQGGPELKISLTSGGKFPIAVVSPTSPKLAGAATLRFRERGLSADAAIHIVN